MKDLKSYGLKTDHPTFIIAEIGINHRGSVETAKSLIDSAVRAGVDAVKFQTYLTEQRAPAGNQEVFDILKKLELPFEAFGELKAYAESKGVIFFSTPFDRESVDYLDSIGCDLYKIASFDIVNKELLKTVAKTGKPVIMSVGMSNLDEVTEAYNLLKRDTDRICLLHCISSYPTPVEEANLGAVHALRENFDCVIGQSDHTDGIEVPLLAVAAGAQILEKHFKIDDDFECIDAPVSITEKQMKELVDQTRRLETILGSRQIQLTPIQEGILQFRRPS